VKGWVSGRLGRYWLLRAGVAVALALYGVALVFTIASGGLSPSGVTAYEYPSPTPTPPPTPTPAIDVNVTGDGTISGPNGNVSFSISFKLNDGVTSGSCTVTEPKSKTKIKCLDVTSLTLSTLTSGALLVVIDGHATVNGVATTFEIKAVDAGTPGVGRDSFAIQTPTFSRGGVLTEGNITVHLGS
jgi:hypothetical protein